MPSGKPSTSKFKDMIKNVEGLEEFVDNLILEERLDLRESFFGGQTNAAKFYHKAGEDEKVLYSDVTSLYPYVNKYGKYPVGHPQIITKNFKNIGEYFGISKIKFLPPRQLYHPVLPFRSGGKLKLSLCRTCATLESKEPCGCSEEERAIIGTWCTPEIETALTKGYEIEHIYEIYHWENTTQYKKEMGKGGLFAEYINYFLKLKLVSGPRGVIQGRTNTGILPCTKRRRTFFWIMPRLRRIRASNHSLNSALIVFGASLGTD